MARIPKISRMKNAIARTALMRLSWRKPSKKIGAHLSLATIKELFSQKLNVTGTKKTISEFLQQVLGYSYDKADAQVRKLTPERLARIRRFLIEYADALQKERACTHIIVVMDES